MGFGIVGRIVRRIAWVVMAVTLAASAPLLAAERYVGASAPSGDTLRIDNAAGLARRVAREPEQVGFDHIAVAPDGRAVGWLALFPNCCTSYPIPLKLQIYSNGKVRSFEGNGLPVWQWCFTDGGRRVAFEQETVHGGIGVHYELRDVASGRLVVAYDPPYDAEGRALEDLHPPAWVTELEHQR